MGKVWCCPIDLKMSAEQLKSQEGEWLWQQFTKHSNASHPKSYNVSNHYLSHHGHDRTVCREEINKSSRKSSQYSICQNKLCRFSKQQLIAIYLMPHEVRWAFDKWWYYLVALKKIVEMQSKDTHKRMEFVGEMLGVQRKEREILVQIKSCQT